MRHRRTGTAIVWLVIVVTIAVAVWRTHHLAGIEPRYDQAYFAFWVGDMVKAGHVLPIAAEGQGMVAALEGDDDSLAHHVLRQLYNKPTSILTLMPLAIIWAGAEIFGPAYHIQAAMGIVAGTLVLPAMAWFFLSAPERWSRRERIAAALFALGLAGTSYYLTVFSPLGIHNFGIAGLALAAAATQRWLTRTEAGRPSGWTVMAVFQIAALFSHWTNLFLLPAATVLAIFLAAMPWRDRLRLALAYAPVMILVAVACLPMVLLEASRGQDAQTHSLATVVNMTTAWGPAFLSTAGAGLVQWVTDAIQMISPIGFAGGLGGLVLLWWRGMRLPALLILIHILWFALMEGFAGAHLRTFPYVIPPLLLGFAALTAAALSRARVAQGIAALAMGAHLVTQAPALWSWPSLRQAHPAHWAFYYKGQGELRPMVREIQAMVPDGALLLTWSYDPLVYYRALAEDTGRGIVMPSALDGMWMRHRMGTLNDWLSRRRVDLRGHGAVYLLTSDDEFLPPAHDLESMVAELLGADVLAIHEQARLVKIRTWPLTGSSPGHITLWEVVDDLAKSDPLG